MVTQCHRPSERNQVQAFNDFLVFGSMAIGSFSSGKVLASFGWTAVNEVVFPVVLAAGALLLWSMLRAEGSDRLIRLPRARPARRNCGFSGHFRRCVGGVFLAMSARLWPGLSIEVLHFLEPGGAICPAGSNEPGLNLMTALGVIVLCGLLAIAYGAWATTSVLNADAGSARMQEIAAAVREGAQAYLKRQYTTIAIVGVVIFLIVG